MSHKTLSKNVSIFLWRICTENFPFSSEFLIFQSAQYETKWCMNRVLNYYMSQLRSIYEQQDISTIMFIILQHNLCFIQNFSRDDVWTYFTTASSFHLFTLRLLFSFFLVFLGRTRTWMMEYNLHNSCCLRFFDAWCAWALRKASVMVILIRIMRNFWAVIFFFGSKKYQVMTGSSWFVRSSKDETKWNNPGYKSAY